ncbi:MAG: hypothetical protein U0V64_16380 [Cyclobacteriaceae bacterium]
MKNEDELQNRIVSGAQARNADESAYELVFKVLATPPKSSLPEGFADRVTLMATSRKPGLLKSENFWLISGVSLFLLTGLIVVVVSGFKPSFGVLRFLQHNTGLFLFAGALILAGLFAERKLLRSTHPTV